MKKIANNDLQINLIFVLGILLFILLAQALAITMFEKKHSLNEPPINDIAGIGTEAYNQTYLAMPNTTNATDGLTIYGINKAVVYCSDTQFIRLYCYEGENCSRYENDSTLRILNLTKENCERLK